MKNTWKTMLAGAAISSILFTTANVEAASYTVQKGDTLSKIAKAHNTTTQQLKQWNKLNNDFLSINQKLVVASTATVATTSKKIEDKKVDVKPTTTYTVVKGDNLTKIAKKYNTTVALVKQWNKLTTDALFVGQKLTMEQAATVATTSTTSESNKVTTQSISSNGQAGNVVKTAIKEEAVTNNETVDEKIAKQLASEEEIKENVSSETATKYTQILQLAKQSMGIPYRFGGNTVEGFDCSGFVSYIYNAIGINLTRKSSLMYFEQDTTKVKDPVPGDLVFFKNTFIPDISHMGIYIGNNEFIHASSTGIAIGNVTTKYWSERFVAYKRLNVLK